MRLTATLWGVLLWAGPLFSQVAEPAIKNGQFNWFALTETKQQVTKVMGLPRMVADFAADFVSWQYQVGDIDHEDFSHQLVFRKSTQALISITRNYDPERSVDEFFPQAETSVYSFPDAQKPQFSVRLRRLSNGRILMAMGTAKTTGQLVLIHEQELRNFYPWLFEQLNAK